jgi:hypothetical protein
MSQGSFLPGLRALRLAAPVLASAAIVLAFALPAVASATQTLTLEKKGTGTGTVVSSPAGINCGVTCAFAFAEGAVVTLTASPASGTAPVVWSGCETITVEKKCRVTMSAAKTVTATFDLAQRELKVTKAGTGTGTVTSSPAGINCGGTCTTTYTNGTVVTLSAVSGPNTVPATWTGCAKVIAENKCEVSMTANKAITATFKLNQVELNVSKGGLGTGTVKSTPAGIECGAKCAAKFDEGSTVTLTGSPGANTEAVKWSGCSSVNGEGKCLVTMSEAKAVTATFNVEGPQLSVVKAGDGVGTVTSSPAALDCGAACAVNFVKDSTVTLTAVPGLHTEPAAWSGCTEIAAENKCKVTMSAAKAVTATFNLQPGYALYHLSVAKTGSGAGAVTGSAGGIECGSTCSAQLVTGTEVALTPTPAAGSVFERWYGGGCTFEAVCKTTIGQNDKTVTAVFTATGSRTLTVQATGTGAGTVVSKPQGTGVQCSATCSYEPPAGTLYKLVATPAAGSTFAGFSGACTGTGACKVRMDEARSVTATFAKVSTPPAQAGALSIGKKAKVKGAKALLRVSCKGPASCRGSLKLSAKLTSKGKARNATIGSAQFSLAPGFSTTLKIKLSAKAKQQLKSAGQLSARVSGAGITPHAVKLRA